MLFEIGIGSFTGYLAVGLHTRAGAEQRQNHDRRNRQLRQFDAFQYSVDVMVQPSVRVAAIGPVSDAACRRCADLLNFLPQFLHVAETALQIIA